MKCTLKPEIQSISGRCGNLLYKTFTRPNGKKETRVYVLPRNKRTGGFGYERKTPASEKELAARAKFAIISERIKTMPEDQKRLYQQEWKAAKYKFNGKKYGSLRGYIMARLYDEQKKTPENGPLSEES